MFSYGNILIKDAQKVNKPVMKNVLIPKLNNFKNS